jgi:Flp pilus assembly protein TadG
MDGLLMRIDDRSGGTRGRRGVALVLSALLCLAFIPMVGLAIDGSIAYLMRLKVSTALDAAVVAGARSLNTGANPQAESANAIAVATEVFNADMPTTQNWGVSNVTFSAQSPLSATHIRTVTGSASATIPLMFMSVLGVKTTTVSLTAQAQRRDLNVMLVLDHSGSMSGVITTMDTDAAAFVNSFAAGRDNVGLVTFAGSSYLAYTPKTTFQSDSPSVPTLISQITTYSGGTNTAAAIWMAYQQLQNLNQPGALNVIVLFTDGLANNFTANFNGLVSPSAGCTNLTNPVNGVIGSDTGVTFLFGLFDPTAQSLNDPTELRPAPNANGCATIIDNGSLNYTIGSYLTSLPSTNVDGNSTNGTGSISAYAPVTLNQINPINVTHAGLNALDDAANRIRSDTSLTPIIYTIGLGNNPGLPPDQILLARVANDPSSASYNSAQPTGLFVFSPTIAQLHSAFLRIASQVLRLSQ